MMLEDSVKAEHTDILRRENGVDALSLRDAVRNATRAEHLEGMKDDNATP
jgi:hypothetical protein